MRGVLPGVCSKTIRDPGKIYVDCETGLRDESRDPKKDVDCDTRVLDEGGLPGVCSKTIRDPEKIDVDCDTGSEMRAGARSRQTRPMRWSQPRSGAGDARPQSLTTLRWRRR